VLDVGSQQFAPPEEGAGQELMQSLSVLHATLHAPELSSPGLPPELELLPELVPCVVESGALLEGPASANAL
jgi:hypothetical protein